MHLSPTISAKLATAVYGTLLSSSPSRAIERQGIKGLNDLFDLERGSVVTGSSGTGFRQTSGFALVLPGVGPRQGEYVVATRGTVTIPDWLSNLNAAVEAGPGGHMVHAGFNRVCKSLLGDILGTLRNKNPSAIHCVGHSLGGAVSNLIAAQLDAHVGGASLYTFGAPRVGMSSFSEALTWALGDTRIFRAFNISDAVPMVPVFPYFHASNASPGALVGDSHGLVSIGAHFMSSYAPAVEGKSWEALRMRATTTPLTVDQLLDRAADAVRIPGGGLAIHLLGRALAGLLQGAAMVFGTAVASTMTLQDRMAWLLMSQANISLKITDQLLKFSTCVLHFAGLHAEDPPPLTMQYLGYLLGLLFNRLASVATAALSRGEN